MELSLEKLNSRKPPSSNTEIEESKRWDGLALTSAFLKGLGFRFIFTDYYPTWVCPGTKFSLQFYKSQPIAT